MKGRKRLKGRTLEFKTVRRKGVHVSYKTDLL